jgi:hypothetical protein
MGLGMPKRRLRNFLTVASFFSICPWEFNNPIYPRHSPRRPIIATGSLLSCALHGSQLHCDHEHLVNIYKARDHTPQYGLGQGKNLSLHTGAPEHHSPLYCVKDLRGIQHQ